MGAEGRKKLIDEWSAHLPSHSEPLPAPTTLTPNHNDSPTSHRSDQSMNKVYFWSLITCIKIM